MTFPNAMFSTTSSTNTTHSKDTCYTILKYTIDIIDMIIQFHLLAIYSIFVILQIWHMIISLSLSAADNLSSQ